jgi:hypothetical protein
MYVELHGMKDLKTKFKKIHPIYSENVLLKSEVTCSALNMFSNFAVVTRVSFGKAITPIVTRDIKIPKEDCTEILCM